MRTRDLLLCSGAFAMLASMAFIVLSQPSAAGELQPPAPEPTTDGPAPDRPPKAGPAAAVDGGPVAPSLVAAAEPVFKKRDRVDTTGWTRGVIRGDIALTASVIDRIQSISVVVDELKVITPTTTERPKKKIVNVKLGVGTPTFEITNVEFSDYGYVVRVHSPGLNGEQQTVQITADSPLADGIKLAITPGVPYSLLLRDQDLVPLTATDVRMLPVGDPQGRPGCQSVTDNFGSAVFESLLAGDYEVMVGDTATGDIDRQVVTVQPGGVTFSNGSVRGQGQSLIVPRGVPVTVAVFDSLGYYGIEGVHVKLLATDRTRLTMLEASTDISGHATFPRVLAGRWEVEVVKDDHERQQRLLNLDGKQPPGEVTFKLVRRR